MSEPADQYERPVHKKTDRAHNFSKIFIEDTVITSVVDLSDAVCVCGLTYLESQNTDWKALREQNTK